MFRKPRASLVLPEGEISDSVPESPESLLQKAGIRSHLFIPRYDNRDIVQFLDAMLKHRAINFVKNVSTDLNGVVGADTKDVPVKSCMMQLT